MKLPNTGYGFTIINGLTWLLAASRQNKNWHSPLKLYFYKRLIMVDYKGIVNILIIFSDFDTAYYDLIVVFY